MKIAGLILVVLGALALIFGGIRYTTQDRVLDIGPIHATAEREHSIPIAPIAGALLLVAGAAVLITRGRQA